METKREQIEECCKPRPIAFGRFGMREDPKGAIVLSAGRLYRVLSTYRREAPAAIMLRVSYLNGEAAGELAAGAVKILPDHFHVAAGE